MIPNAKQVVHLLVSAGPDKGQMFFLKPTQEALIGRVPGAELRLTDPGVSGRHCLIRSAGDMVFIEDLNSRNGTQVNGEPATTRVLDENGRLEVGSSVIELTWVATESELPLGAVASPAAPTLLEGSGRAADTSGRGNTARLPDSTMAGMQQLQEFRQAQTLLGTTVCGHLLLEVIGVGPLGFVYRARNTQTREDAALKLIRRSAARAPQMLERFLGECRADLRIPGAARLLATGGDKDYCFLAMEYVRGRSWQTLLDSGTTFTPVEAVNIAVPLCETLHAAHALGVVHRELKPANIMVREDAPAILLDLGLGKKTDSEGRSIVAKDERLETLSYTSPELTRESHTVDGRADGYALAAVLFRALSGQRPFTAPTRIELVRKIRWDAAPLLNSLRADVPQALAAAIARALEKEAPLRYPHMLDFAAALKQSVTP